jgi:hypothetical protein
VPDIAHARANTSGHRHTMAAAWNAPIDAPAVQISRSGDWQSARIAATTSWRT